MKLGHMKLSNRYPRKVRIRFWHKKLTSRITQKQNQISQVMFDKIRIKKETLL